MHRAGMQADRRRVGVRRTRRGLAALLALALVASACGDDGGDDTSSAGTTAAPQTTAKLQPVSGGTLTFAAYSAIPGLDPLVALGSGTSGGIQMSAVYDTLLRYDPDTKKYTANMAELPTANADFTEWTVKLKPGITFTDGTALDAEAVKFNFNRHRSGTATLPATQCAEFIACPRNPQASNVYMALIKDMVATDKTTLKITLTEGWSSFPYAMASEPGMIASPTALKKCDGTKNPNTCEFNLKPVGAGPFVVTAFKPQEAIEMARNPNYFGGQVYLEGLKFVALGDLGGEKTYDAFRTGTVQGAYLRVPSTVARAKADKATGLAWVDQAGETLLLNMGVSVNCAGGKPEPLCVGKADGPVATTPATASLKVRQAVAAAFDSKQFNDRVYQGQGLADTALFQKSFPWDPGVAGPKYDLEAAKRLVNEAKAEGWNGTIKVLFTNSAVDSQAAVVVEAMLRAAGMNPVVDATKDSPGQQTIVVSSKDFEISRWGTSIGPDDSALWSLAQALGSNVASNRIGFKSDAVDKALKDLRLATDDAQRKAQFKIIAEEFNRQIPWLNVVAIETLKAFSPKVHGVTASHRNFIYFDKAWMER